MMRDVLDDDERKVRPVTLLMITTGAVLSAMIVYNGLMAGSSKSQLPQASAQATTRMQVTVSETAANTVVFKYDANVEDVQRELLAAGFYKGMVDGVMGQRTAQAIQQYQQENGFAVTGLVSPELVNHIRYTRKIKAAAEFTGSLTPAQAVLAPAVPPALEQQAEATPAKPDKRQSIFRVQMTLANMGYDLGEPSGIADDATRAAILQYEMDNGLAMEGVIDQSLLASLTKIQPKNISTNN
jgi:peptidoglycan hydrolase-like protein with peptidoglycan-binding domain